MVHNIEYFCQVISKKQPNSSYTILKLKSSEIAATAMPGQFVDVASDQFLRRPFGIMSIDREHETFSIGIRVQGQGTLYLSQLQPGDTVSVLGPLGRGFKLDGYDRVITVGGGTGVFPLFYVQQYCRDNSIEGIAVCGYRSAEESILTEEFTQTACAVSFASNAGDMNVAGHAGIALKAVIDELVSAGNDISKTLICVCGPKLMMQAAAQIAKQSGIACQVSLEERMACGIGVCLVCVCKIKQMDDTIEHSRCCIDGPVFDAEVVVW